MKRCDITFRSTKVTNRMVRINLSNLFKRTSLFKSNFIKTTIKVSVNNNNIITLYKDVLINRKDKQDIKTLIKNILESLLLKNITLTTNDKISIFYIESEAKDYKNYKSSFKYIGQRFYTSVTKSTLGKRLYSSISLSKNFNSSIVTLSSKFYSTKSKYSFRNVEFPIMQNTILNDITPYFEKFINENKAKFGKFISVICQVREIKNVYYTLGDRFPIDLNNSKDLSDYLDYIQNKWSMLDNNQYNPSLALSILFNFTNTDYKDYLYKVNKIRNLSLADNLNVNFKKLSPLGLPLNMYYTSWGDSFTMLGDGNLRVNKLYINSKNYIDVTTLSKTDSLVKVFSSESGINLLEFTDKVINKSEFVRIVGKKFYYIKDNKLYFIFDKLISNKFISRLKPQKSYNLDIMTLDVETYVDENNNMNIYCISFFDGKAAKSYFLTDYNNINSLIADLLKNLFSKKYSGKSIYIHNSSEFDMIFLYSSIINYKSAVSNPVIKDGKFINLEICFGKYHLLKVYFRDSFLLLTSSLAKLSNTFNVTYSKDMFPHNFVTKNNLNYVGSVPEIKFFNSISDSEYNEYKARFTDNNWSLKSEAIKYCEMDCKALYEVIQNFALKIFKDFNVNISTAPTLPSAAMKTYRTNFIPKEIKISKIGGNMFDNINKAFYGGHVDMYIPTNQIGTQVFGYDVNSLYPHVMKVNKYPYEFVAHFYGDISKMTQYMDIYNTYVGYFNVNITAPQDILHPIIPKKVNNTTVYGVGSWNGWYYSEELLNAKKYGYTFNILEGYLFKSADLFANYVNKFYYMKEMAEKNSPDYVIAKLFQNSLFGKFSMFRELTNYAVLDQNGVNAFISKIGFDNFVNKVDFGDKCLVSFKKQYQDDLNINIAIGAAVTANARIYMSQFKNNPDYILYYTDTDSGYFNKPLPDYLVDSKRLGALKLEHVLNKFVALGPKVYGGVDISGNEFTKTKGLKSKISVSQLETLLQENISLDIPQEKWFNNLVDSNIAIKNSSYNLRPTNYKRELIYENGTLVGTSNKEVSD